MVVEELKNGVLSIKTLLDGYKNEIEEKPLTLKQIEKLEKAILKKDIIFFVLKKELEAIAMCSISRTFSTFNCNYSGVFEDFYILPEYRKLGIARKLTEYVFNYSSRNNIYSLWVGSANCDVEMYKNLGFEIPLGNLMAWNCE